ncbi:Predicted ATPase of the ABC class [Malonomonas rubra DSM 5091]|uniref:Predicted ATPase of the ABC class n=1 Tax=Malonomonas rubra DSM 5091 TaxID=1122189 RepID=A0A1M6LPH6_MALRU|nr:ABC-ATPase domain-containing protein [Malonomonas rubra]SHJ73115.1 Predicted ATPase of the ABC class [Malonomonas rubra DSM 5091]
MERLRSKIQKVEGRGYKAYKELQGEYDFGNFRLSIDHVQGDPFALPSRISVQLSAQQHGIPAKMHGSRIRTTALEDYLARCVSKAISKHVKGKRGTGRSGEIAISCNGQQVLRRNAVIVDDHQLEARLLFALPGTGRSIPPKQAAQMFFHELPQIIAEGLTWRERDREQMCSHVEQLEDQQALREQLTAAGAVAFVADGSLLARRSGIDDRPMSSAVPTASPGSLRKSFTLPNRGAVAGMAIPPGVTLIVGGGFHGKSTLLQALELGIYNQVPGDGRELVATIPSAVKIRAEDHRVINKVDISPFIGTLPGNRATDQFSTDNASGSTSQAANIIEALECGCNCLLIDEDTSATNFMIRDARMQQLVPDTQEPITPLQHRVRQLYQQEGVSSIIVCGGSGDYLSVADTVIMLDNYHLQDVSAQAKRLAGPAPKSADERSLRPAKLRQVSLAVSGREGREAKIQVREKRLLDYGRKRIDLSKVEQLVDAGQTEAIGRLLHDSFKNDPQQPDGLRATLEQALTNVDKKGLDILLPWKAGHLAMPRLYELMAAANRLRESKKPH